MSKTMSEALRVISKEHRNLFALLTCLRAMVRDASDRRVMPDLGLLDSVLDYLESYLNRFHHPKESEHLFPALRRCRADIGAVLDELDSQHGEVGPALAVIREALAACRRDGLAGLAALRDAVERYAEFEIAHMSLEESEVMPAARESLSTADWKDIDSSFLDNDDPLFGQDRKKAYRRLYSEIAARAPAPYGLGDSAG